MYRFSCSFLTGFSPLFVIGMVKFETSSDSETNFFPSASPFSFLNPVKQLHRKSSEIREILQNTKCLPFAKHSGNSFWNHGNCWTSWGVPPGGKFLEETELQIV